MSPDFYRTFEERMRGSREVIAVRLRVYQPLLTQLAEVFGAGKAVDIGCGRGEWLGLLRDVGIDGHGIDLDEGMLAACQEAGLSVEQGDGLRWLAQCDNESLTLVSAFHVAEHLSFEQLQALVREARRVLRPGGVLLLEAPNPENLTVGAHTFYVDPTHEKPLPASLLNFLTLYHGFARSAVWRLQEAPELRDKADPGLTEVLLGVSPDYAVIAQAPAAPEFLAQWDEVFAQHRGVALSELAGRFDQTQRERLALIEAQGLLLQQQESALQQQEVALQQQQQELSRLSLRLTHVERIIRPWTLLRRGLGAPWRAGRAMLKAFRG